MTNTEAYQQAYDIQIQKWLDGNPTHHTLSNEHVPDFSCCDRTLTWPDRKKLLYISSDPEIQEQMLCISVLTVTSDKIRVPYINLVHH